MSQEQTTQITFLDEEPFSVKLQVIQWEGEMYIRATPVKKLFQSNLIHDVITRGDVFALRLRDQALTVIPGTATVVFLNGELTA